MSKYESNQSDGVSYIPPQYSRGVQRKPKLKWYQKIDSGYALIGSVAATACYVPADNLISIIYK